MIKSALGCWVTVTVTVTVFLFQQRILKEHEQPIPTLWVKKGWDWLFIFL
jgi:hypothetical protein